MIRLAPYSAHIAGISGKHVTRGRIQVVVALDPAGPLFFLNDPQGRVADSDAVYVEVMHTNGGVQGFREPIGQAGFFPNFGRSQPGCGADTAGVCAHARTVNLYAESISTVFTGHECVSFEEIDNNRCTRTGRTARMGGAFGSIGARGNFHLTTNAASPFSQG
jgi:pancreatic triacylglycerol lipase